MFIAIIGTRSSGCSTVENYLVSSRGFISVRLASPGELSDDSLTFNYDLNAKKDRAIEHTTKHLSFLTFDATPLPSPSPFSDNATTDSNSNRSITVMNFRSPPEISKIEMFLKRPFFMLLSLDAPLIERFRRSNSNGSLQTFVAQDDEQRFGKGDSSLKSISELIHLRVVNDFPSVSALEAHIESLDLLNPLHLRPDWDMYFMTLASPCLAKIKLHETSRTTELHEASGIVMKEDVLAVMAAHGPVVTTRNASVFMQKRTRFWKRGGTG
ncbi:hypothetical protein BT96DRAFT_994800 [Gymnopus androsaceus JB14]|uniref:Uncharacterized protein n=1 Tax=Gymnopus androsaceus JB14 TaxID=1447944 RepID=A0A6A4HLJ8_9AGAR|nr:hypothetical protein BT96DRAFT_994800 [Gymnopus androsaceus JB14]